MKEICQRLVKAIALISLEMQLEMPRMFHLVTWKTNGDTYRKRALTMVMAAIEPFKILGKEIQYRDSYGAKVNIEDAVKEYSEKAVAKQE